MNEKRIRGIWLLILGRVLIRLLVFRMPPEGENIVVECNQYVEMLADNVLAPYTFKHVSKMLRCTERLLDTCAQTHVLLCL